MVDSVSLVAAVCCGILNDRTALLIETVPKGVVDTVSLATWTYGRLLTAGRMFKAKALSMAKKEPFSTSPSDARIKGGQRNPARASSRPTPEDGRRLIHAFMDIKQAALREAVIRLVIELSKLNDNEP
jgi:hypothetical protein